MLPNDLGASASMSARLATLSRWALATAPHRAVDFLKFKARLIGDVAVDPFADHGAANDAGLATDAALLKSLSGKVQLMVIDFGINEPAQLIVSAM